MDVQDRQRHAARRVGSTVGGKYRLTTLLGIGGTAAVYAAVHRNGHRVAIKVLHPELTVLASVRERFLTEGYKANAVEHDGAVLVLDDDVAEDGCPFLVMELLEGESIDARWRRRGRRMPVGEVVDIARRLLDVLAAAHEKNVVHRDVKPENIFLTADGRLKVLDFGTARLRDPAAPATTGAGRMLGTPAFMPREQALGYSSEIDARSDVWAVGATMFTLLCGRNVHEAETPEAVMVLAATRPAPSLGDVASDAPRELVEIVDRALAFDKADRFPDARAMRRALERAYPAPREDEPAAQTGAPLEPSPARARRGLASTTSGLTSVRPAVHAEAAGRPSRRRIAAVAAVTVAVAAAVLFVSSRRRVDPSVSGSTNAAPDDRAAAPPAIASAAEPLEIDERHDLDAPRDAASAPSRSAISPSAPAPSRALAGPTPRAASPSSVDASAPSPAASSCDPPYYYDPVDHGRKVKPGCS
jgi:serine/threonine-protein kinase